MLTEGSTTIFTFASSLRYRLLGVMAIVIAVEIANDYEFFRFDRPVFSVSTVSLLVTALWIFLVFRVNEAYSRWWEARTLWGNIVNASRSFARRITTLVVAEPGNESARQEVDAVRRELVYRQIAWVNALRLTLRGQDDMEELRPFLPDGEIESLAGVANWPTQLLQRQGVRIAGVRAAGRLSDFGHLMLDGTMAALHDAQGGCERIKNTPFPDRIVFFTQGIAWMMAFFIPVAIAQPGNGFDWIDMVVVPFMMLAFVSTERVGAELKNPFEGRSNDTPMTALCRTIEIDLRQQLGEKEVPPALGPVKGVVM
jgi:putative membrane protein